MSRWAARIEYLGTAYSGWQRLAHIRSVQQEVETAIASVAAHPVVVHAAGRTDAGVHGLGQVIHFDSPSIRSERGWMLGCNVSLPPDISVRWVMPVADHFHARYKAFARHYRYVIHNSSARSAMALHRAAFWPRPLDAGAMHQAARCLIGEQDFSALRDSECQSSTPMRKVTRVDVWRAGEFVVLDVSANAFLHHMVRNIAGTLMEVGMGRQPVAWVAQVLASRDRKLAGMTAPAGGLTFIGPEYPAEFGLPEMPKPWFPATMGS